MKKLTTLDCAILLSQSALAQLKIEEPKPKIKKKINTYVLTSLVFPNKINKIAQEKL